MLGNGRLEAYCFDGVKRMCHIRGKLRKKVWINQGDVILIGLRDFQDAKADVIMKYNADETRNLKNYGEIPDTVKIQADNDIEFMAQAELYGTGGVGAKLEESSDESSEANSESEDDIDNVSLWKYFSCAIITADAPE